jgi:hypothetical protein
MATQNANAITIDEQPSFQSPYGKHHGLTDVALLSLRLAERMCIISEGIVQAADDGESYETLVNRLKLLHHDLECLEKCSNQALHEHGFYLPENKDQLQLID